jgi:hypothetical protein
MQEAFREDSDLVGFIQATNVEDAVDILAVKVGSAGPTIGCPSSPG